MRKISNLTEIKKKPVQIVVQNESSVNKRRDSIAKKKSRIREIIKIER